MSKEEMLNHLILSECERFGECHAQQKHHNHDYYAHKDGFTKFLESGSKFPNMPFEPRPQHEVKVTNTYPQWHIDQHNERHAAERKKKKTETDEVPF